MIRRLFGWWRFSEAMAGRLAEPRRDLVASDTAVWEMIQSSRLFAIVQAVNQTVARAWPSSRVGRLSELAGRMWLTWEPTERLRVMGRCTSTAAVTVIVLQTLESAQGAPFRWMLPLAFGIAGGATEVAARPIVRIWKRGRG